MAGGRPTVYSEELAFTLCKRIALGESLRSICQEDDMPNADTVFTWILDGKHKEFSENYARARASQAELMFDELLEIADDASNDWMLAHFGKKSVQIENKEVTNRSRLRVDTRKWYLSKVLPKKFGDKLDLTSDGKEIKGNTIVFKDFDGTAGQ